MVVVDKCTVHGLLEPKDMKVVTQKNILCLICVKEYTKKNYKKNLEKRKEKIKNDPELREKSRLKAKNYRDKIGSEELQRRAKLWRHNNPERYLNISYKRLYGITYERYMELLAEQNYVCKMCNEPEVLLNRSRDGIRRLAVDHCHKTGAVRGLLCTACNTGLGCFKEDKQKLLNAIRYIEGN